jgi:hypothetical protein
MRCKIMVGGYKPPIKRIKLNVVSAINGAEAIIANEAPQSPEYF